MSFVNFIKKEYSKSYHYFNIFYKEEFDSIKFDDFEKLAFEYQFGIFISFFNSVSTDVDIFSNEKAALEESIKEAFSQYEEYLFLDS